MLRQNSQFAHNKTLPGHAFKYHVYYKPTCLGKKKQNETKNEPKIKTQMTLLMKCSMLPRGDVLTIHLASKKSTRNLTECKIMKILTYRYQQTDKAVPHYTTLHTPHQIHTRLYSTRNITTQKTHNLVKRNAARLVVHKLSSWVSCPF